MREKKPKTVFEGMVKIPGSVAREIDIEAAKRNKFKYEIVLEAWELYRRAREIPAKEEIEVPQVPGTEMDERRVQSEPEGAIQKWVVLLVKILSSGHAVAEAVVKGVLIALGELCGTADRDAGTRLDESGLEREIAEICDLADEVEHGPEEGEAGRKDAQRGKGRSPGRIDRIKGSG